VEINVQGSLDRAMAPVIEAKVEDGLRELLREFQTGPSR
jgi:hypothetical protein